MGKSLHIEGDSSEHHFLFSCYSVLISLSFWWKNSMNTYNGRVKR